MRLWGCALLLVLVACSEEPETQPQARKDADRIECALGEGSVFGPDCLVERAEMDGVEGIVVRHPDGGFRRFILRPEGGGLVEVDGADEVSQSITDGQLEIAVASDRYRFPARPVDMSAEPEGTSPAENTAASEPQAESNAELK